MILKFRGAMAGTLGIWLYGSKQSGRKAGWNVYLNSTFKIPILCINYSTKGYVQNIDLVYDTT
jgi:hypothetical protein